MDIIEKGMKKAELTNRRLAEMLDTTPAVIAAILAREIPIPLMWIPNMADAIEYDAKFLMSLALGEQWLATLTAIAGSLLWEEGAVQRELIDFFTRLGGGECPSMSEDPALAERLEKAFRDPDDDRQGGVSGSQGGPVH
ncbi:hypothetical protein FHP25_28245 [Vineibacter terrae]|uniref:Uncharacterized protein n=1 Tax=Vineibacter terrae TaxID=2586908 RepID=A0A5C8PDX4_9HYPH|nr:hypothetical protein [Vineibacter terrae]TXL71765.1 hypothetical protein FHP25_28245 [Vineibacter terrae]